MDRIDETTSFSKLSLTDGLDCGFHSNDADKDEIRYDPIQFQRANYTNLLTSRFSSYLSLFAYLDGMALSRERREQTKKKAQSTKEIFQASKIYYSRLRWWLCFERCFFSIFFFYELGRVWRHLMHLDKDHGSVFLKRYFLVCLLNFGM